MSEQYNFEKDIDVPSKQIIIDGVDVSGCLFYYDNGKCSAILGDDACKDWHNCSYKLQRQLDQLKATNEELRQILWNVDFNRQSKGKKLIRIEELLKKCATGYTDEFIQEMFSILHELEPVCRYNKLEQLSKTLAEIKEIAETAAKCMYATYSDDYTEGYRWLGNIILQKISECEGNDDLEN